MWSHPIQRMGLTRSNQVAALFLKVVSARDAIADLKIAGFCGSDIGVAFSQRGESEPDQRGNELQTPDVLEGKHSIRWKVRHSFEHDLHSQGGDLSSKAEAAAASEEQPGYTEIDLADTLRHLEVAEDTIRLLNGEMGTDGVFVLVHAGDRGEEAESILDRNRGFLRTVMVTERTHAKRAGLS
jgi:hypothetical protein